jgi:hypothetical protein
MFGVPGSKAPALCTSWSMPAVVGEDGIDYMSIQYLGDMPPTFWNTRIEFSLTTDLAAAGPLVAVGKRYEKKSPSRIKLNGPARP